MSVSYFQDMQQWLAQSLLLLFVECMIITVIVHPDTYMRDFLFNDNFGLGIFFNFAASAGCN